MVEKPNLFFFATRELSQDAFLAWLAAWATPGAEAHDGALHSLGVAFLTALGAKHGRSLPPIQSLEVSRQHKSIDILIVVNKAIVFLIEDKVYATDSTEKLRRYVTQLLAEGYPEDQLLATFVQTGDQSNYQPVTDAGFKLFRRSDLLELLRGAQAQGIHNAIVQDFLDHLTELDRKVVAFLVGQPTTWDWYAWTGFFQRLQSELRSGDWDNVVHRAGSFLGFWWNFRSEPGVSRYLQLEESRLCFKMSVDDPAQRGTLAASWSSAVIAAGSALSIPIGRPSRIQPAQTMTIAVLKGDYRVASAHGSLELAQTLAHLRDAERVMENALTTIAQNPGQALAEGVTECSR